MSGGEASSLWSLFGHTGESHKPSSPIWKVFSDLPPDNVSSGPDLPPVQQTPSAISFNERLFYWALRNIPEKEATEHLAVIGTIRSGKTTLIRLLLQSIGPRLRAGFEGDPQQLIVFDPKFEAIPILAGLGFDPEAPNFYIFNPNDERSASWNIADGAKTPLMARDLAALLVPEEPRSSAPYFADSARDILYAVILGLNFARGTRWTLRDLILALDEPKRIRKITAAHPRARIIAGRILNDEKHAFGVLSSLAAKIVRLEPVAALWHTNPSKRQFTIDEFLKRPGVLVLGGDPNLKDTLQPINSLLIEALTQKMLSGEETKRPRHWFILDEFAEMGKVECINQLLRVGRSKGVSVLLGLHGIEGLIKLYEQNLADQILGLCTYKTFLRASTPNSAHWATSHFDKARKVEMSYSETFNQGERQQTYQYQTQERNLFNPSVFLDMPLAEPGGPFFAISDVPCEGSTFISRREFDQMINWLKPKGDVLPVMPRNTDPAQTLYPWEPEEEELFCGAPVKPKRKRKVRKKIQARAEPGDDLPPANQNPKRRPAK